MSIYSVNILYVCLSVMVQKALLLMDVVILVFSLEEEQTVCTENLILDLGQLLVADGGHYSDVELVCQGGEVIRCHKNILSARHGGVDHGIPTFPFSRHANIFIIILQ